MGVIIGVVVGYALGTHAGEEGWTDFKDAWKVISASDEVRDLLAAGFSVSRDLIGRGSELLAGALGTSDSGSTLHRVA
jgi:hypothetical protein